MMLVKRLIERASRAGAAAAEKRIWWRVVATILQSLDHGPQRYELHCPIIATVTSLYAKWDGEGKCPKLGCWLDAAVAAKAAIAKASRSLHRDWLLVVGTAVEAGFLVAVGERGKKAVSRGASAVASAAKVASAAGDAVFAEWLAGVYLELIAADGAAKAKGGRHV